MKIVTLSLGCILLGFSLFAYEDEENRVRNWLEDIWLSLSCLETSVHGRLLNGLRTVAKATAWVFAKLYGEKIVAVRAYITSTSLCTGVGLFIYGLNPLSSWLRSEISFLLPGLIMLISVLCFGAPVIRKHAISYALTASSICAVLVVLYFLDNNNGLWLSADLIPFLGMVGGSSVLDFCAISTTRWAMRTAAQTNSLTGAIACFAVCLLAGLFVFVAPYYGTDAVMKWFPSPYEMNIIAGVREFNLLAFVVCFAFLAIAVLSAACRIVLMLVPRMWYPAIKLRITENRRAVAATGVALIGVSYPEIFEKLKALVEALF